MKFFVIILIFFSISGCINPSSWRNKAGIDPEGYDIKGFKDGFDRQGYGYNGCNRDNFDRLGNACKEVCKIKEKNFSYKQFERAQANIEDLNKEKEELKVSINKSEQDKQTQIQKLTQTISIQDADILQKTALISTLQNQLAQATQDANSWQQKYTNENLLLGQRDKDLNLAQIDLINKNNELVAARQEENDAKLELKNIQDLADTLRLKIKNKKKNEKELLSTLGDAQEIVKAVQEFIRDKVSKLEDPLDKSLICAKDKKNPQTAQTIVEQLNEIFNQSCNPEVAIEPKILLFKEKKTSDLTIPNTPEFKRKNKKFTSEQSQRDTNILEVNNPNLTIPSTPPRKHKKDKKEDELDNPNLTIPSTPKAKSNNK